MEDFDGPVVVYLLANEHGRTYVGCSARSVARRLRQHNGELAGGAAQTATGRPWQLHCVVTGFRTRREGLQFEFAWRRLHRRARPRPAYTVEGRLQSLNTLRDRHRWSSRAPPASEVSLRVVLNPVSPA